MADAPLLAESGLVHEPQRQAFVGVLRPRVVEGGLQPLLQTPRALPHPPSGATAVPSATTSRAGASACPCARGGTTHPSAPQPRGTVRTRSRRSGPWPPRRGRPAPPASVSPFAPRPTAQAGPGEVGRAVRQGRRRCSAPRHRAAPAAPCPPALQPQPVANPRAPPRSPAGAPQPPGPSPGEPAAAVLPPAGPCGLSAPVHPFASSPNRVGRNQNHFGPRRLKSRPSQKIRGSVLGSVDVQREATIAAARWIIAA